MVVRKEVKLRCSKYKKQNKQKMTEPERILNDFLQKNNIDYIAQYSIYSQTSFILIDFYIPKLKLAIEIDGGCHKRNLKYGKWRERLIAKKGLKLVRLWNEDVLNNSDNLRKFKAEILSVL